MAILPRCEMSKKPITPRDDRGLSGKVVILGHRLIDDSRVTVPDAAAPTRALVRLYLAEGSLLPRRGIGVGARR